MRLFPAGCLKFQAGLQAYMASVVPLFWNSRHTQTSLQTVPIYSPRAAHSCQEHTHTHTVENQLNYPPEFD